MTLKMIDSKIRQITANAAKLNALVHSTGILILTHAREHGDCTRALTLHNALPASFRRTMLKLWFETYSPIRLKVEDGLAVKVAFAKPDAKGYTAFDLDAALANPFYTLAEANPEGKVLDFAALVKMVAALSKRIEKQIEDGKVVPEDTASAKAIANVLSGLNFVKVTTMEMTTGEGQNDSTETPANDDMGITKLAAVG